MACDGNGYVDSTSCGEQEQLGIPWCLRWMRSVTYSDLPVLPQYPNASTTCCLHLNSHLLMPVSCHTLRGLPSCCLSICLFLLPGGQLLHARRRTCSMCWQQRWACALSHTPRPSWPICTRAWSSQCRWGCDVGCWLGLYTWRASLSRRNAQLACSKRQCAPQHAGRRQI